MAHTVHRLACLITILALSSAKKDQSRWSRQISTYTSDMSDWVPLTAPIEREPIPPAQIKRQSIAEPRILSEPFPGLSRPTGFNQEAFPSRAFYNTPSNRQLYLQTMPAVPSAPQNFLTDQGFGHSIRFGLSNANFPLSQGFVTPQFGYDSVPQIKTRPQTIPSSPIKFETFQNPVSPHVSPMSPQAKPFNNQIPKLKPEVPKFVDGYRVENITNEFIYNQKKKPQSLQKIKFESFDKSPKSELTPPNNQKLEREEVQLLYVPLESLNRGQFNFRSPLTTSQLINTELYSQSMQRPSPQKQTLGADYPRPLQKPVENFSPQDYFSNFMAQMKDIEQVPTLSTGTTPLSTLPPITHKPKKLKPHQPPLAIFLTEEASRNKQIKVGDVLSSLKTANTIAVLDAVNPLNAPNVFIGPSNLQPPEKFVKFELPYLSNIEHSDKKLRQLPFFVAPLSYNTPQGFAKIPFPSPHVGSVVINSQIKDTTQTEEGPSTANIKPNYYVGSYKQEQSLVTQKPSINFYSTVAPKATTPSGYKLNYYSFEPQMVSSLRTTKQPVTVPPKIATVPTKTSSYFLSNAGDQYNPSQFIEYTPQDNYKVPEPVKSTLPPQYYSTIPSKQIETTTTTRATITTTARPQSTYSSQLLETHNPYSINQAFHFSTPLDYHNYFDEYKETFASPGSTEQSPPVTTPTTERTVLSSTPNSNQEILTDKQKYPQQTSANYLHNYTPEIHYESEDQNSRYPAYNTNDFSTKTESSSEQTYNPINTDYSINPPVNNVNPTDYNENQNAQTPISNENLTENVGNLPTISEVDTPPKYEYNQYETSYNSGETKITSTTSSTTTRRPLRSRGRPRYTTSRPDSSEYTTKAFVTRRPLRERRPLPTRPRYEPNKITTEKPTRKPVDYGESSTKSTRTRTRGRIQYRPSENEDIYDRRIKSNSKEQDLAYQRDVLHQNYPVTLVERTSTVDIEAITEPAPKISSTKDLEPVTETYDTENAYTNEKASISQQISETEINEEPALTPRTTVQTSYLQKSPSSHNEEYIYQSRSSLAPVESIAYDEIITEREEDSYQKQTTPVQKEKPEVVSLATEATSSITEQNIPIYSLNNAEFPSEVIQEETTTAADIEDAKIVSQEENHELEEEDENIVQTTPSYNRVRVRPGVIRQYHQASAELPRIKTERKRLSQTVTYRPAYDRRRTTMRIEEIEADLKTKQVHARPEVQDYRHPVYQPELSTETAVTSTSIQETTTKRGHFRRRRPSYSTTSTEATRRNTYEVKNRFRGRRPTEKPTEKPEVQSDSSTTTARSPLYTRYSHRPRLSERYNKKTESQETESEDQDSNFSISRPKYAEAETGQWSPKISTDSFKPYNPNDIIDDQKIATTEQRTDKDTIELDIITARNEYEDILISVTPATNNRNNKKIPDIPPTLEALVEQSKVTKSDSGDSMSTFETMLEEVMKSLEEQDEDEYTTNVMKHKGGEIGEIPPEIIISSGDVNTHKTTLPIEQELTTVEPTVDDYTQLVENENDRKSRRRGFWKKVKVRPVTTESIEVAESQYYSNTVNMLGQSVKPSKSTNDKSNIHDKTRIAVTTYKPHFQFFEDIFGNDDGRLPILDILPNVDIPKLNAKTVQNKSTTTKEPEEEKQTTINMDAQTMKDSVSPGDFDMGTGSPDPTVDDTHYTTPTEPTPTKDNIKDKSEGFSFMDYLFGATSDAGESHKTNYTTKTTEAAIDTNELSKLKIVTTESTYIPEEITDVSTDEATESVTEYDDIKRVNSTQKAIDRRIDESTETPVLTVETSTISAFMNPANVMSTSMSTEVSHETEICFRGKCIKTNKDVL